jgi:hypothetical protein
MMGKNFSFVSVCRSPPSPLSLPLKKEDIEDIKVT